MAEAKETKDEAVKSQLEEVEHLLEEGDKRIQLMVNTIPNALAYFLDQDGKILFANTALADALKLKVEDIQGKEHAELMQADETAAKAMLDRVKRVLDSNQDILLPSDKFAARNGYTKNVRTHMSSMGYMGKKAVLVISMIMEGGAKAPAPSTGNSGHAREAAASDARANAEEVEDMGEPAAKKARTAEPEPREQDKDAKAAEE